MSTKLTYALGLTVVSAVLSLLLYFTGYQTEKLAAGQSIQQWLGFALMVGTLWLGIRAVRDERGPKGLSYGGALGTGVLISLYSGLMSSVYSYVHFKFINTEFFDYQMALVREGWAKAGMSGAQMEQAEAMASKFMGPGITAAFTTPIVVIIGLIVSLILAAFLKRAATESEPSA